MRVVNSVMLAIALVMLGVISYNTGVGKTFPVHHPNWMSCDSLLTRQLFYSTLLKQQDGMDDLAAKVKKDGSIADIDALITQGSNISASQTKWFESVSKLGECQAQIYLQSPTKNGDNTAYISFSLTGYIPTGSGVFGSGDVLEAIQLNALDIKWTKE